MTTSNKLKKIGQIALALFSLIAVSLYHLWQTDKLHKLPDLMIVLPGALIPVMIVLTAVYFASKSKKS